MSTLYSLENSCICIELLPVVVVIAGAVTGAGLLSLVIRSKGDRT